ncbi:metallophosphoesterase family protein [Xanthomonas theicola]|uniref:YfcE family phosphodiesterase n=1 Tax=Xanthomonas theicola TaxID=56464 RepID=A0A2S6ZIA4_9XANT|nr:metallophosphoesterase family protein [Xanthomonas theicola]PPT91985.1 YfcE family phosphodiesterase [Xanthomonas theicola]QNH24949.1 metallophosphoesterase family protein [Xanthomonas theicola]
MRLAALSDIHGNLPALEAVLADIGRRGVERIVNLGDIVSGPLWPRETAARLMPLALPTVRGNHERQLCELAPAAMGASDAYAHARLTPAQRRWLDALPPTLALPQALLCHGTPHDDLGWLLDDLVGTRLLAADAQRVRERLGATPAAALVLCGHSHVPRTLRLDDGRLLCNPGSIGLPAYAEAQPQPYRVETGTPQARYALLEYSDGRWDAQLLAVDYDHAGAAAQAQRNGCSEWAHVLRHGCLPG